MQSPLQPALVPVLAYVLMRKAMPKYTQGGQEDIVAEATVEKPVQPHIRLMHLPNKKQDPS